ncbi:hypothetical protein CWC18_13395 [Pseudoalteromonas aurantia]|uniref:Methyltransferase domain-containing protein n=3 Tax=Pseudoalteromonas TaxID=53246 RepID=A0ABY2VZP2_9GAMM|nr:hypothetical protein CWC18_13395 [Pseudoalteromonas aurantia]TMO76081.1 hypothetical protein CWC20_06150 [Pseudoalteromonas aurantia]
MRGFNMPYKIEACTNKNIDLAVDVVKRNYDTSFPAVKVSREIIDKKNIELFLITDMKSHRALPVSTFGLCETYQNEEIWQEVKANIIKPFIAGKDVVVGQFSICEKDDNLMKIMFGLILDRAQQKGYERLFFILKKNDKFYRKLFNAVTIKGNCNFDIGSKEKITALVVDLNQIHNKGFEFLNRRQFLRYSNSEKIKYKDIMMRSHWDKYSSAFDAIMAPPQVELYSAISQSVKGEVLDGGCGNANLAAFLKQDVSLYHGVDSAQEMIVKARENILQLEQASSYSVYHSQFEEFVSEVKYDVVTFVNSFYAVSDPSLVFKHSANLLKSGGKIIIANPNEKMTKEHMQYMIGLYEAKFRGHPAAEDFKRMNLQFVESYYANFYTMQQLKNGLTTAGFTITHTDNTHYHGAVNLIIATK